MPTDELDCRCLFPNGVSLAENMDVQDTIYVDVGAVSGCRGDAAVRQANWIRRCDTRQFDGQCLEYLLAFFEKARRAYAMT